MINFKAIMVSVLMMVAYSPVFAQAEQYIESPTIGTVLPNSPDTSKKTLKTTTTEKLHVKVTMARMKCLALTERNFDQIYVGTAVFRSGGQFDYSRIPTYPHNWPMKIGNEINNQALWKGELEEGQAIIFTLSLIEQDLSVFNPDDLVGLAKLEIRNQHGQFKVSWSTPNSKEGPKTTASAKLHTAEYQFSADKGTYVLNFKVEAV